MIARVRAIEKITLPIEQSYHADDAGREKCVR